MVAISAERVASSLAGSDSRFLSDTLHRLDEDSLLRVREAAAQEANSRFTPYVDRAKVIQYLSSAQTDPQVQDSLQEGDVAQIKSLAKRIKTLSEQSKISLEKELIALLLNVATKFKDRPVKDRKDLMNWLYTQVDKSMITPLFQQMQELAIQKDDLEFFTRLRPMIEYNADICYKLYDIGQSYGEQKRLRDQQDSYGKVLLEAAKYNSHKISQWVLNRETDFLKSMEAPVVREEHVHEALAQALDSGSDDMVRMLAKSITDNEELTRIFTEQLPSADPSAISMLLDTKRVDKSQIERAYRWALAGSKENLAKVLKPFI